MEEKKTTFTITCNNCKSTNCVIIPTCDGDFFINCEDCGLDDFEYLI